MIYVNPQTINFLTAIDAIESAKMVDGLLHTFGSFVNEVTYKIDSSGMDVFAFLNTKASSIKYTLTSGGEIIATDDVSLMVNNLTTWYDYLRGRFSFNDKFIQLLPFAFSSELEITVRYPANTVEIGMFICGEAKKVGITQRDSNIGFENFTRSERNLDGSFVEEIPAYVADMLEINIQCERGMVASTINHLKSIRDRSLLILGDDGLTPEMTTYGKLRNATAVPEKITTIEISIEGQV